MTTTAAPAPARPKTSSAVKPAAATAGPKPDPKLTAKMREDARKAAEAQKVADNKAAEEKAVADRKAAEDKADADKKAHKLKGIKAVNNQIQVGGGTNISDQELQQKIQQKLQYDRVGYGKPPQHSRFKPGRSGNPKGKKRATRSFGTEVRATLGMPVVLTDSDRPRKVTTSEAALMRLREKALRGDGRSLDRLIELRREYCDENDTTSEQMDEEEWLACIDPSLMLELLPEKPSERKMRLFGLACCRRMWHLFPNQQWEKLVEVGEQFIDQAASRAELNTAWWRVPTASANPLRASGVMKSAADSLSALASNRPTTASSGLPGKWPHNALGRAW